MKLEIGRKWGIREGKKCGGRFYEMREGGPNEKKNKTKEKKKKEEKKEGIFLKDFPR